MTANQHGGDDPFLGQVLDGKYRIDSLLGQGGMGAVYRATHILMDHQCAVKVLHTAMMSDPAAIPRFQREARAAAKIRHQNAIAVNDFGITSNNVVYLVMEYFPGQSLRAMLREHGAFTVERTAKIIDRVAAALDAAHQQGIIHRDVKPDNVMLRELPNGEDEVKVLDFGIAKMIDQQSLNESLTITGTIIGTPHYLSPEQCRAATDLDSRSDLYSLAVVTHEMLTGTVPFVAATPIAVAMMHISDPPPPLFGRVPGVSQEAENVVHRAMGKKREERQASVVQFAAEFYEAVFGFSPTREGSTQLIGQQPRTGGFPGGYQGRADTGQTTMPGNGTVAISQGTGQTKFPTPPGGFPQGGSGSQQLNSGQMATPVSSQTMYVGSNTPATVMYAPNTGSGVPAVPAPSSHKGLIVALAVLVVVVGGLAAVFGGRLFGATPAPVVAPPPPPTKTAPPEAPPNMVLIPAGTFMMGRDAGDVYERPAHTVDVKSFYLDKTEVTNKQYQEFVQSTGYAPPADWQNGTFKVGDADLPVTNIEWKDARAYAEWAKKRLPTEAEWEYAARGTDGRLYPWGNDWVPGRAYTKESGLTTLQPVGSSPAGASPYGILDMAGNAWEWCDQNFAPYPGSTAEPKDLTFKIIRGGSLGDEKVKATTTYRNWVPPEMHFGALGFRCAKSVE